MYLKPYFIYDLPSKVCKKLAKEQRERLEKNISLKHLYKLSWGEYPKNFDEDVTRDGPIWQSTEEDKEKTYYAPPHTGFLKK
jgi:hypothetical protein